MRPLESERATFPAIGYRLSGSGNSRAGLFDEQNLVEASNEPSGSAVSTRVDRISRWSVSVSTGLQLASEC
jgi:hypothetical protein